MAQDVVGLGSLLEASFKQHRDCLFILVWDSGGDWAGVIAGKPAPTGVSAGFGFLVIGLASSRASSLPQGFGVGLGVLVTGLAPSLASQLPQGFRLVLDFW